MAILVPSREISIDTAGFFSSAGGLQQRFKLLYHGKEVRKRKQRGLHSRFWTEHICKAQFVQVAREEMKAATGPEGPFCIENVLT